MRKINRLPILACMVLSIWALGTPGQSANQGAVADFCTKCEAKCYEEAENVLDYNACVALCNYAGCVIPYANTEP